MVMSTAKTTSNLSLPTSCCFGPHRKRDGLRTQLRSRTLLWISLHVVQHLYTKTELSTYNFNKIDSYQKIQKALELRGGDATGGE